MKIIIVYALAGAGHLRAAEALFNYLRENFQELDVALIDILDYTNSWFKKIYALGYAIMVSKFSFLWKIAYRITYAGNLKPLFEITRYIINRLNTKRFKQFLFANSPEIILATHFLPAEVASILKKENKINSKLINIITDFNIHPFWVRDLVDYYIVGAQETKQELIEYGVPDNKIRVLGIPIDLRFSKIFERRDAFKKSEISKNKFTVLIVTGTFGLGPIEKMVDLLKTDAVILVVCGTNKGLFSRLKRKKYESVRIFGLINNIEELMAISDIVITKPGGLTIAECLTMELPMVFISAIYGQETKNARLFEKYGVATNAGKLTPIKDIILDYKNNPDRLYKIKEKIREIKRPFAVNEIALWLLQK